MQVDKGDYLVVGLDERKRALVKVLDAKKWPVKVVVANESQPTPDRDIYRLDIGDIFANLGPHPEYGASAYGVRIEPWVETWEVKGWGIVHVFRLIPDDVKTRVARKLQSWGNKLGARKLFHPEPFITHIKPKSGRWAGHYAYRPKDTDTLALHPEDLENLDYIITHEHGHHIWFRLMNSKLRARWIKLYHRSVTLQKATSKQVQIITQDYVRSGLPSKEFAKDLGETEQEIFDEIIDWIHETHKLEAKHLDTLLDAGQDLAIYMPDREFLMATADPVISEYGSTKVEEYFAEAMAFYWTKQPLPAGVTKLIKRTLKAIS